MVGVPLTPTAREGFPKKGAHPVGSPILRKGVWDPQFDPSSLPYRRKMAHHKWRCPGVDIRPLRCRVRVRPRGAGQLCSSSWAFLKSPARAKAPSAAFSAKRDGPTALVIRCSQETWAWRVRCHLEASVSCGIYICFSRRIWGTFKVGTSKEAHYDWPKWESSHASHAMSEGMLAPNRLVPKA